MSNETVGHVFIVPLMGCEKEVIKVVEHVGYNIVIAGDSIAEGHPGSHGPMHDGEELIRQVKLVTILSKSLIKKYSTRASEVKTVIN